MYGNDCYEKAMENLTEETCDCPMECNTVSYSFSIVSTPLEPKAMCPDEKNMKKSVLMKPFYVFKYPQEFVRKLIYFKNNISSSAKDYCERNLQYRAKIIFRLATDSMSVTVMSRRLSFFDKLSDFGEHYVQNTLCISLFYAMIYRRYLGPVHWYQYRQYGGGSILGH